MVEEVADISRQTAADADDASAAATEQAASMSQVGRSVTSLSEQAERLQALLASFEVGGERRTVAAEDRAGAD